MELWEILDENGNKTGRTVERGQPMRQDEYHLVVHIWIRNSAGEYLISKRTPNKTYPNLWAATGGSAIIGEDSLQAALRETKEELGIDLVAEQGQKLFRTRRQHADFPDFLDVWLFKQEVNLAEIVCQPDEVAEAKWATPDEIMAMLQTGDFVGEFTYLNQVFSTK